MPADYTPPCGPDDHIWTMRSDPTAPSMRFTLACSACGAYPSDDKSHLAAPTGLNVDGHNHDKGATSHG